MSEINFSPKNIGHAIVQCDENGNVIEIQSEDITPLADKLKQRQQQNLVNQ